MTKHVVITLPWQPGVSCGITNSGWGYFLPCPEPHGGGSNPFTAQ